MRSGLIAENVLLDYRPKKVRTYRQALTIDQVESIERVLMDGRAPEKIRTVARWFLFSCYTGLRYADLKGLRWASVVDGQLILWQNKTSERVVIPLIYKAKKLMGAPGNGFVFGIYSNQKCNEYLKVLAAWAGIDQNLTFHIARHTFATVALNNGIALEVVSALLGHQDIKVTRIYAKMLDDTLKKEMRKME